MKHVESVLLTLLDADWSTAKELAARSGLPYDEAKEAVRYLGKIELASSIRCGSESIYWIEPAGLAKVLAMMARTEAAEAALAKQRAYRARLRARPIVRSALGSHLVGVWQ